MTPLKVMIVDDSIIMVQKLQAIIQGLNHTVVKTANDGRTAVSAYRECQPDLVTMDITMPEMDGIEATRQIVADFPEAKIIMVTSHGQEAMVRDAIKAGACGYVIKPVKPENLTQHIEQIFAS
jgi:two-component system chemotaxis response regulator CheY